MDYTNQEYRQELVDRQNQLVNDACENYGMMNEVIIKARMLKLHLREGKEEESLERLERLKQDFHTYNQRFEEISEGLHEIYEELSNIPGLGLS